MKRLINILITMLFLINWSIAREYPPGEGEGVWLKYRYNVTIEDQDNNPIANVEVGMVAIYRINQGGDINSELVYQTGYTDGNGYVVLEKWVDVTPYWPDDYSFYNMSIYIADADYSVLSSQNATSYFSTASGSIEAVYDQDGDLIDDNLELQLAEKFSPVLHKHPSDKQQGLSNVDWILSGRSTLKAYNVLGQNVYSATINSPSDLHVSLGSADRDSHGKGEMPTFWRFDIMDEYRYAEAPAGQRPLYYHVYKEGNYYYVQYWYFFNMNDIIDHTENDTWHEGDFEHVTLKVSSTFEPIAVNFYRHEGGVTISPSLCWWSNGNDLTYSGLAWGYNENSTHLHIWVAANSHASYNRNYNTYHLTAEGPDAVCPQLTDEDVWDNVDYDPSGYNLYFEYDYLEKLGEYQESPLQQASNGYYYPYAHDYYWFEHYEPKKFSKPWLTFTGRFGEYWGTQCIPLTIVNQSSPAPLSPAFGGDSHEWQTFTENYSIHGFGNSETDKVFFGIPFGEVTISWEPVTVYAE